MASQHPPARTVERTPMRRRACPSAASPCTAGASSTKTRPRTAQPATRSVFPPSRTAGSTGFPAESRYVALGPKALYPGPSPTTPPGKWPAAPGGMPSPLGLDAPAVQGTDVSSAPSKTDFARLRSEQPKERGPRRPPPLPCLGAQPSRLGISARHALTKPSNQDTSS